MELVDQSPIGRSSRSNPATYIKAWDESPQAPVGDHRRETQRRDRGHVLVQHEGGRCEVCQGAGVVSIDMQFLADVEVSATNATAAASASRS
jgi:excinuclease ABC subunit A